MTPSGHTVHMITTRAPRGAGQEQVRVSPPRAGFDGARARSGTWEPLAGDALLDRVRHTGRARPMVDPVLADGLRSYLQRGLDDLTGAVPTDLAERVLVVTKDGLANSLSCPTHRESAPYGERPFTLPLACAVLVGLVFRQIVAVGSEGDAMSDAMSDALDALALDEHQAPLASWIAQLAPAERSELQAEVDRQADGLRRRWPAIDPSWLPRTQESLRVGLAEGRVQLAARVDLVLGTPAVDESSVALVEVRSGARRPSHRDDLHFIALLETLRSTAAPFSVATYYARTGELDVDPVTPGLLAAAARRCLAGIRAMAVIDQGMSEADSSLCAGCIEASFRNDVPEIAPPTLLVPAVEGVRVEAPAVVPFPRERAA